MMCGLLREGRATKFKVGQWYNGLWCLSSPLAKNQSGRLATDLIRERGRIHRREVEPLPIIQGSIDIERVAVPVAHHGTVLPDSPGLARSDGVLHLQSKEQSLGPVVHVNSQLLIANTGWHRITCEDARK